MSPHAACGGEGCPSCYMTGQVDRWGLSHPRPLFFMPKFSLMFMAGRIVDGRYETYDLRPPELIWLHMWWDIGVMRYYDSAWEDE